MFHFLIRTDKVGISGLALNTLFAVFSYAHLQNKKTGPVGQGVTKKPGEFRIEYNQ
jgi:hypothetical protein